MGPPRWSWRVRTTTGLLGLGGVFARKRFSYLVVVFIIPLVAGQRRKKLKRKGPVSQIT
jgi:hypothetical protein